MNDPARNESPEPDRYETIFLARCPGESSLREYSGSVSGNNFTYESGVEIQPGTQLDIVFKIPHQNFWLVARGVVHDCLPGLGTVAVQGRFTEIQMADFVVAI